MEKLVKLRAPIRTSVTKTVREINEEFDKQEIDGLELRHKARKLEENLTTLQDKDEKILEFMVDSADQFSDADYEAENEIIEEYRDKIRRALIKIEDYSTRRNPVVPTQGPPSVNSSGSDTLKKTIYKLPKIELKKFNDDVLEWLSWWSQFKKIHQDEDLDVSDKFQYLVQSMAGGSKAKDIVESYPMTANNYPKAIEALKSRFGREEMLIEVYVRELQKLVIKNFTSTEKRSVSKMFDKLESHLRSLESLGVTSANYAAMLYPMIESSFPEDVLRAWKRSPMSIQHNNVFVVDGVPPGPRKTQLDYMMDFLKLEVESEESIAISKSGFATYNQKKKDNSTQRGSESNIATAAELLTSHSRKCIVEPQMTTSAMCVTSLFTNNDEWGSFVGNRTNEILTLTDVKNWRFVSGDINSTDLPSQSCSPKELLKSKWWEGPKWLLDDEKNWSNQEDYVDEEKINSERKNGTTATLITSNDPLLKEKISSTDFTIMKIEAAETELWKLVQKESFSTKDTVIEGNRVLQADGLIRVKTLLYRNDSYLFHLPVLLPHSHSLVDQLIMEVHNQNGRQEANFVANGESYRRIAWSRRKFAAGTFGNIEKWGSRNNDPVVTTSVPIGSSIVI